MCGEGGHVWQRGACMAKGVCMAKGQRLACVVKGGVYGEGGGACVAKEGKHGW